MANKNEVSRRDAIKLGFGTAVGLSGAQSVQAQTSEAQTIFTLPRVAIPIADQKALFPVRRIYCIGRNYAAHAREMGSDPTREPPFFFQKPTDAIQYVAPNTVGEHLYPSLTKNYHYEVE